MIGNKCLAQGRKHYLECFCDTMGEMAENDLTSIHDLAKTSETPAEKPELSQAFTFGGLEIPQDDSPAPELVQTEQDPLPLPPPMIETIQKEAAQTPVASTLSMPTDPYHLFIEGFLTATQRARLSTILSEEGISIRPDELDLQFEAGRIKIPQISEYAGVKITQALFDANCFIHLERATNDEPSWILKNTHPEKREVYLENSSLSPHLITVEAGSPEQPLEGAEEILGLVSAYGILSTTAMEAERSSEYDQLVESLKQEVQLKAFRKGARKIVHFHVQMSPLASGQHYRVSAFGTAIN